MRETAVMPVGRRVPVFREELAAHIPAPSNDFVFVFQVQQEQAEQGREPEVQSRITHGAYKTFQRCEWQSLYHVGPIPRLGKCTSSEMRRPALFTSSADGAVPKGVLWCQPQVFAQVLYGLTTELLVQYLLRASICEVLQRIQARRHV